MKKTNLIYGVALLLVACALLYLVFVSNRKPENTKQPNVPAQNENVAKNGSEAVAIISGWQVYQNKELGFRVDYPSDWQEFDGRAIKSANFMSPEQLAAVQKERPELLESLVDVEYVSNLSIRRYASVQEVFGNKTLEEAFNDESKLIRKLGEIQLDGMKAYEAIGQGEGTYYDIICENNGYVYDIQKEIAGETDRPSETEKQIISSFRFIK